MADARFPRMAGRLAWWCITSPASIRSRSSLRSLLAAGQPITSVTWDAIDTMNRDHAKENDGVTKEEALALLAAEQCRGGEGHTRFQR